MRIVELTADVKIEPRDFCIGLAGGNAEQKDTGKAKGLLKKIFDAKKRKG